MRSFGLAITPFYPTGFPNTLLDVNLPKMDGYQVCGRLKRDPALKHIPVIMLSANSRPEDALKGKAAGAGEYIPKNQFAVEHLLFALESLGFLDIRNRAQ